MIQLAHRPLSAHMMTGPVNGPTARCARAASLDRLGDEIAELAAHIDAATYRLMILLREFDARDGWSGGFRTCAHWLSWRTGIDLGAARERVRVARALGELPALSGALEKGVISYSKVRALTRVATPANEADLLDVALHGTAAHIERVVRAWRTADRTEEAEKDRERHESRALSLFIDTDGSYVLHARLDPETGAVLARALELAGETLHRERAMSPDAHTPPTAAQQRADALGLVAELALRGAQEDAPVSGVRAERFQVVVHVAADASGETISELDSGIRVSAETSRRLSCDATRIVIREDAEGGVLDVGRRTRTVPPALRRALDRRDRGCRFPGCGLRHCDAHHVTHWADGGGTSLGNLVLLCRFHHRLVHEEGYAVAWNTDGMPTFRAPDGSSIADVPSPGHVPGDVVRALREMHDSAGIAIGANTAPVWQGGALDLDLALQMLRGRPS